MIARTLKVTRLHTVAWPLLIAWPLGILAISFVICLAIFYLIGDTGNPYSFTGAVFSLYGFALIFYLQAMTQTFPFAMGLSVTRRDYFTATTIVAVLQTLAFGLLLFGLAELEGVTDGFGVKMRMFDIPAYFTDNPVLQLLTIIASLFLLTTLGMLFGALQQRWRAVGFMSVALSIIVVLGLLAMLLTWQGWWLDVGRWFRDVPRIVPLVVIPGTASIAALLGAWATVRRTSA